MELFHVLAYRAGLQFDDLQLMSIGMVLDFIQEFIDQSKPQKGKKRKANQADFDAF